MESLGEMRTTASKDFRKDRSIFARKKLKQSLRVRLALFVLRDILAAPLYRAARLPLPEPLTEVLDVAKSIVPTRRPGGELMPFIGETVLKLRKGYDLILNVAPEGCMVSSMGETISNALRQAAPHAKGKVEPLFSQQGDVDESAIELALLRALGPARLMSGDG
jgi:predicted nucleotide-binding protein (sugar kinase/HSP70/actin superfamily)